MNALSFILIQKHMLQGRGKAVQPPNKIKEVKYVTSSEQNLYAVLTLFLSIKVLKYYAFPIFNLQLLKNFKYTSTYLSFLS